MPNVFVHPQQSKRMSDLTPFSPVQLHLTSYQATTNAGTTSPTWSLAPGLLTLYGVQMTITFLHCEIPLSYYTIRSTNNTLSVNGVSYQISQGNWSASGLATYLTTLLTSQGISVSYSSVTNKFTFACSSGEFDIDASSTCLRQLGFSDGSHTSEQLSLTSDQVVDLSGTSSIYITSNLNTQNYLNGVQSNVLVKVPVLSDMGTILVYQNPSLIPSRLTNRYVNMISVNLLDDSGDLLDLNGLDWAISLQVDYIYTPLYKPPSVQSFIGDPTQQG
jgi:hypothetical protein